MLGKARRGVLDGEKGGPYLTSGLKHSFRKGKGRRGQEKKPFQVQSEIKAILSLHSPFGWRLESSVAL